MQADEHSFDRTLVRFLVARGFPRLPASSLRQLTECALALLRPSSELDVIGSPEQLEAVGSQIEAATPLGRLSDDELAE